MCVLYLSLFQRARARARTHTHTHHFLSIPFIPSMPSIPFYLNPNAIQDGRQRRPAVYGSGTEQVPADTGTNETNVVGWFQTENQKRMCCMRACVRACMRACAHACVRACVHACMRACVRACVHACVHAPYSAVQHMRGLVLEAGSFMPLTLTLTLFLFGL